VELGKAKATFPKTMGTTYEYQSTSAGVSGESFICKERKRVRTLHLPTHLLFFRGAYQKRHDKYYSTFPSAQAR